MTVDLHLDYESHLRSGRVWRVKVEVPWTDAPDEAPSTLDVAVDVIAPNRDLAQYIATTIYSDYCSIFISDEPLNPDDSSVYS